MSNPWTVLAGLAGIAVLYVLLPVMGDAFARFRGSRGLRCPETGTTAEVGVDAGHAALTAVYGEPDVRVGSCSLWPERQGCAQRCVGEGATVRAVTAHAEEAARALAR